MKCCPLVDIIEAFIFYQMKIFFSSNTLSHFISFFFHYNALNDAVMLWCNFNMFKIAQCSLVLLIPVDKNVQTQYNLCNTFTVLYVLWLHQNWMFLWVCDRTNVVLKCILTTESHFLSNKKNGSYYIVIEFWSQQLH